MSLLRLVSYAAFCAVLNGHIDFLCQIISFDTVQKTAYEQNIFVTA